MCFLFFMVCIKKHFVREDMLVFYTSGTYSAVHQLNTAMHYYAMSAEVNFELWHIWSGPTFTLSRTSSQDPLTSAITKTYNTQTLGKGIVLYRLNIYKAWFILVFVCPKTDNVLVFRPSFPFSFRPIMFFIIKAYSIDAIKIDHN